MVVPCICVSSHQPLQPRLYSWKNHIPVPHGFFTCRLLPERVALAFCYPRPEKGKEETDPFSSNRFVFVRPGVCTHVGKYLLNSELPGMKGLLKTMTTRQPLQGHLAGVLLRQECVAMAGAFADLKAAEMVFEVCCLTSGVTRSIP